MSPEAVKRASYNLAWSLVHAEPGADGAELTRRFQLVTGFLGDAPASLRLAKLIVEIGR